jgi:ribonuclease HII
VPSFHEEERLLAHGYRYIAGIDEVGCGALAGPVVAAAVIMPYPLKAPWRGQIKDSKLLNPEQRAILSYNIRKNAISVGIGSVPSDFIDTRGLTKARRLAMKQAVEQLSPQPESLLIDFILLPDVRIPQKGVVDGDSLCFSIACASIIAKVARDSLMMELDKIYPGYGLSQHKGYGTREHLACLRRLGPSPIHRLSFQPVRDAMQK